MRGTFVSITSRNIVRAGIAILLLSLSFILTPSVTAGTLGGEPPDFAFGSNEPDFTAVAGVNTVTGTLGPTPNDGQDLFEVIIPSTLEVTSVSYSGPGGPHNLVGCGLTGVGNLNQTFSPPQSSCTLGYFINTNFATSASAWTVTVNVHVKPSAGDTTPPVVAAPANITVEATGPAGATVTYPNATATDNVGVDLWSDLYSSLGHDLCPGNDDGDLYGRRCGGQRGIGHLHGHSGRHDSAGGNRAGKHHGCGRHVDWESGHLPGGCDRCRGRDRWSDLYSSLGHDLCPGNDDGDLYGRRCGGQCGIGHLHGDGRGKRGFDCYPDR